MIDLRWLTLLLALAWACSPKLATDNSEKGPKMEASDEEPFLIKIAGEPVYAEEFLYVLSKNASFSEGEDSNKEPDIDESFELFVNYKLKVKEAIDRGYHETDDFQEEFNSFKEEITQPYLLENQVQEGEIQKAYARLKEVIKASHILLTFPPDASHDDSLAVFRMAEKIKADAESGEDFALLAMEHSQDPSVVQNKGSLGYFTAMQMVYPFEAAAYSLNIGQVSDPVLTDFGYHIIKLEDRKPNPGEVRVSHLLIRVDTALAGSEEGAKRKINEIHQELSRQPDQWKELVLNFSEDPGTRSNAGLLPWFGVGAIVPEFEKTAFSLSAKGEISPPVKTDYGYHLIRLEETKPVAPYEELAPSLKSRVLRDSRFKQIQSQVLAMQIAKFKVEENTKLYQELEKLVIDGNSQLDSLPIEKRDWLLKYSDKTVTVGQFLDYLQQNPPKPLDVQQGVSAIIDTFIGEKLKEEEEKELLRENSEYRLLVQEFREGILLFNLMNDLVWQKAMEDSVGLERFFEENREDYRWEERVETLMVKVTQDKPEKVEALIDFLKDKDYQNGLNMEIKERFLQDDPLLFTVQENRVEWETHQILKDLNIDQSFHTINQGDVLYLVLIGEKEPARFKNLNEVRGRVIQDYQSYLEESLIVELRDKYKIEVNEREKNNAYQLAHR
ncbi:peptidylprolyl isomerase [Pleomorphovibrio marinus]|uniref:peptidylprolyl isomerase n=1 Tax=Pleomorphovibrio marinus TaxID=2164132 RepID=UPI000E0C7B01|nr:peptidylprolyl isomerase [Pleomorphovibrio marinus]